MNAWSRDREGLPACAEQSTLSPRDVAPPTPSEPAPTSAAGLKMALAVLPGARGQRPPGVISRARGVMHSAAGPQNLPGCPTRELAGSDSVQPASVVLSLRRRQLASARSPWQAASEVQCGRPNELWGSSQPRARAARSCSTASLHASDLLHPAPARSLWQAASTVRRAGGSESTGHSSHRPRAARSCSALTGFGAHPFPAGRACAPGPQRPSRGAVTRRSAAGRGRGTPATSALTATVAHNLHRSAGRSASSSTNHLPDSLPAQRPADPPASVAVGVSPYPAAPRTTTNTRSLASPASSLPATADSWTCCMGESGGESVQPAAHTLSLAVATGASA